ncbi:hypothetical protein H2248_008960 [Termitomyces sp. 'cryptogamus']|nr:hypothetical protein H2248_008960 [Termitomyces sp. 'cryptogamus']
MSVCHGPSRSDNHNFEIVVFVPYGAFFPRRCRFFRLPDKFSLLRTGFFTRRCMLRLSFSGLRALEGYPAIERTAICRATIDVPSSFAGHGPPRICIVVIVEVVCNEAAMGRQLGGLYLMSGKSIPCRIRNDTAAGIGFSANPSIYSSLSIGFADILYCRIYNASNHLLRFLLSTVDLLGILLLDAPEPFKKAVRLLSLLPQPIPLFPGAKASDTLYLPSRPPLIVCVL